MAAAIATAIAPYALFSGVLFHYSSFDYLWWVLIAYLMVRLLKSGDPRWWLGIGATIGLGLMTKYTIIFLVAGIVVGVILTPPRRYLKSPWLWGGVALAFLIVLPDLIWQFQHNFISLEFTRNIHARDVLAGRTTGYLTEQFIFVTNVVTIPIWLLGLYFYFLARIGRSYRLIGWMFIVPFVLFLVTQGRSYYLAPAYPVLFSGGAVMIQHWLEALPARGARVVQGVVLSILVISGLVFAPLVFPIAPVNSDLWKVASDINGELKEQIGWPELVQTVAGIYAALPPEEQSQAGILTGNYGEAGAINLYGPAYGLPQAISGINSYWLRGYGDPPPQTVIVLGLDSTYVWSFFETCQTAGHITNPYGVKNEETRDHPVILLCRNPRKPWSDFWKNMKAFRIIFQKAALAVELQNWG